MPLQSSSAAAQDAASRAAVQSIWVELRSYEEPAPYDRIDAAIAFGGMQYVPHLTAVEGDRAFVGVTLIGLSRLAVRRAHNALAYRLCAEPAHRPHEDLEAGCPDDLVSGYRDACWPHLMAWQQSNVQSRRGPRDRHRADICVAELVHRAELMEDCAPEEHPAWWLLHVLCDLRGATEDDTATALAQCDSSVARFAVAMLENGGFERRDK